MEVSGQLHILTALLLEKKPHGHWIQGWVGPRAGLGCLEKKKISCP